MSATPFTLESLPSKKEAGSAAKHLTVFGTTKRSSEVARVRIFATSKFNPERAVRAAERIAQLGANVKPSRKMGAAALIRKVRDGK